MMGETAAQLADSVIITADNSRSESTDQIIASIVEGVQRVSSPRASSIIVEPDRRIAISAALRSAAPGDIVLLAGKGHETVQIIGESTTPFDDRVVAFEEWKQLEAAR
jgi:UDP-N-acetylmuramoyl-L-alanyl-D-glutamate--2,6-diaminopimelate ligase